MISMFYKVVYIDGSSCFFEHPRALGGFNVLVRSFSAFSMVDLAFLFLQQCFFKAICQLFFMTKSTSKDLLEGV